jgi:hypothetical protein
VFGDVPVSEMKPDWTPETMPDYFQLKTAASGFTPRSGIQVSSGSDIKLSSTVQEWHNRSVGFPVGLQGVGGTDLLPADPYG